MRIAEPQPSIWSAALMAAGCRARCPQGRSYRVRWQHADDHVRYAARDEVVIEPLGVRLMAGEVLEVRWLPNETSYSVAVRPASAGGVR